MKFGIRVPPCAPATEVAAVIKRAENIGWDVAWIADSQFLWRDVFATMAIAALQTERMQLATAVSNVETRHVSVVASAINTIAELAPGRVILGLGTGDSSVRYLGVPPTRRAKIWGSLEIIRTLLGGEFYDFPGRAARLKDAQGNVPIFIAASGPKMLFDAGQHADGVLTLAGSDLQRVAANRARVDEGANSVGRRPEDVDFVIGAFCHVTSDIEKDARMLKPIVLHHAGLGREAMQAAGIDLVAPPRSVMPDAYPDLVHAEDWDAAVTEAARYVSDDMAVRFARSFCLFNSPTEIASQIRALSALGVTGLYLRHVGNYTLPTELIETIGSEIMPLC